jgi:hypothetical protein
MANASCARNFRAYSHSCVSTWKFTRILLSISCRAARHPSIAHAQLQYPHIQTITAVVTVSVARRCQDESALPRGKVSIPQPQVTVAIQYLELGPANRRRPAHSAVECKQYRILALQHPLSLNRVTVLFCFCRQFIEADAFLISLVRLFMSVLSLRETRYRYERYEARQIIIFSTADEKSFAPRPLLLFVYCNSGFVSIWGQSTFSLYYVNEIDQPISFQSMFTKLECGSHLVGLITIFKTQYNHFESISIQSAKHRIFQD